MSELPAFLEPVVPERVRTPYEPGNHAIRAEASRIAVLSYLDRAQENLAALSDAIRTIPDDDEVADELIRRFTVEVDRAGVELTAFRNLRECAGQA